MAGRSDGTLPLVLALPAGAAEIIGRNASQIRLVVDGGQAYVSFLAEGHPWHVFVSGAINARRPSRTVKQVKFKVDYSGGRGAWKHFRNTCGPYDGPPLAWFLTPCKASDGSYWALQAWQRMLPNNAFAPTSAAQKVWELHISHWTGPLAQLEVYRDWVYGGRSFVVHRGSGMFCYGFYPSEHGARSLTGNGRRYRATLSGPGVTPDVAWVGDGLPNYDAGDQALVDLGLEMKTKLKAMAATYGDAVCGHH